MSDRAEGVAYNQWAEREDKELDTDGESDSFSSPVVARGSTAPMAHRGFPGSPRRNGVVLDADIRSIFRMTAACDKDATQGGSPSPSRYHGSLAATDRKTWDVAGSGNELIIPPSLSGLSLQSASSGSSWQSPSSTSSRKHSLEIPFDGSPQRKRRLTAEMSSAANSFRYSAPCVHSDLGSDGIEPRGGGFLRRSGAPIQSMLAAAEGGMDRDLPAIMSYFGSRWNRQVEAGGGDGSPDPPCLHQPQPDPRVDAVCAVPEKQPGRRKRLYSFWRFTLPPNIDAAIPERDWTAGSGGTESEDPAPGSHDSAAAADINTSQLIPAAAARRPQTQLPRAVSADADDEDTGGARLDALHTLEGDSYKKGRSHTPVGGEGSFPSEENPIIMCGNRLYSEWTGYWNGAARKIPGGGALFPEGYEPRVGHPEPWICPVRDCQTIFADAWALGGHFSAGHRACLLNDNLDGTMSVIGKRKTADPSSGRMPPLVVSRSPIDAATGPPKANPRRPGRRKRLETSAEAEPTTQRFETGGRGLKQTARRPPSGDSAFSSTNRISSGALSQGPSLGGSRSNSSEHSRSVTSVYCRPGPPGQASKEDASRSALWQYLMTYLPHGTPLPDSSSVLELLFFARQRELPYRWKFQLAGGHPSVKTLCAVLVYLTGVKRQTACDICAGSEENEPKPKGPGLPAAIRPFPDCIAPPDAASAELKGLFGPGACCNSFYRPAAAGGKRTHCVSRFSLSSSDLWGTKSLVDSAEWEEEPASAARTPSPTEHDDPPEEDSESGHGSDSDGRSSGSGSNTSISLSPTTLRNGPRYRTALPARVAGKPRMVSVRKAGRTPPAARAKRQSSIRRLAARLGAKAARREVAVYKPSESVVEETDEAAEKQSTTAETASTGARRSRRLLEQRGRPSEESSSKQEAASRASGTRTGSISPSKPSKLRKRESQHNNGGRSASPSKTGKPGQAASDATGAQKKTSTGALPSLLLMMADWEIAPGRIRTGTGEDADNIAFSSSYLAQGRSVPVSADVTFQVLEIQPGGSLRWEPDTSRTRLCSVARGIVRVKLPEREFPIGPNGMWKVTQGVSCTVVNPFHLGAVLHVTALGGDGC